MANIPTGIVTFLFTDIEDSTALWQNYPTQMQAALKRHDEIFRSNLEAKGGYVFALGGDAFSVAFNTPIEALQAVLAIQRALFAEEWPENVEVRVRMALHAGVSEERDGAYFGPQVNRAARLMSAGHGGQILLSAVTYGLVRDALVHIEPEAELRDLGEHRLNSLSHPERIFQLVVPDLPKDFPPLKTLGHVVAGDPSKEARKAGFKDRYRFIRSIDSDTNVYLARDEVLDQDVAIKVIGGPYTYEEFNERLNREARDVASLSHPNIVAIHDWGETEDGSYYMAMEHLPGGTLKERVSKEGPLPPTEAVALALQVARALRVAHERGMIHRSVKPQSILLTESWEAKVTDFVTGWAIDYQTATGADILGSAHYISPEQVMGEPGTPQSDLYSLGVILYEMLTGELPYDADTPMGVAIQIVKGPLPAPKEVNPNLPERVNTVVTRLLAKDPEERYPSASMLITDLTWMLRSLEEDEKLAGRLPSGEGVVLWVDDRPDNNIQERKYLVEDLGVRLVISTSTEDALEKVRQTKFDAIISDMGRPPDPRAGYTLLDELRRLNITAPFIIYAGSNAPEHKAEAKEHGALGSTNAPQELFQLVMSAVSKG